LPRLVELLDGDNALLIDFANPLSIDAFASLITTRPYVTLTEMLPSVDSLCVSASDGTYVHELYVPVVRYSAPSAPPISSPIELGESDVFERPRSARRLIPGSPWLFAKLYAGVAEADRLLSDVVYPLLKRAQRAGYVDRWFFIRYADPEPHIRLRLRGDPQELNGTVLPWLTSALAQWVDSGLVSRLQIDTYEPELERYGGPIGVDMSEQLFQADSLAALDVLQLLGSTPSDSRWPTILCGLDHLATDLTSNDDHKQLLIEKRRRDYARAFGGDSKTLKHLLGQRYRLYRSVIESIGSAMDLEQASLNQSQAVWERRSAQLAPVVSQLREADAAGRLTRPLHVIAESYLHMFVNRMVKTDGKAYELVMFDFLLRLSASTRARANASRNSH